MITDRTGRHAVLLSINLKYEKICDVFVLFFFFAIKNQKQDISRVFAYRKRKEDIY